MKHLEKIFDESLMKILNGWDLNQMDYKPLLAAHL